MRTLSAICAVLLLAGALPYAATAADELPRVRMVSVDDATLVEALPRYAGSRQVQGVGHCSIVGAVQSPGTYTGSGSNIMLQTLLEQAGGLTGRASGIVRILHDGQQRVINLTVSAGTDLVPWESVIVADAATNGVQTPADREPLYCDIACVNLCGRPAVFCLQPQHASLPQLLRLLGQSAEVASTLRVILPAGAVLTNDQTLPSGSVVLFDAAALNQRDLAAVLERSPLQDLVAIQPVGHLQVSAEVVEDLQTLETYLQSSTETTSTPSAPETVVDTAPLPESAATLSAAPPTLSAPDPVVELAPENTLVRPASAFQLQPVAGRHPIPEEDFTSSDYERAKQKTLAAKARAQSDAASDEVVSPAPVDANTQWLRFGTSVVAWLLCGLAAYGAFGIWMRQHEKRRRDAVRQSLPVEPPNPAAQVESRTVLSQLIENSLPIREEEATSPCQVFHGRTVGFRYLIRSGPHGLQGPHFAAQRAQHQPAPATAAAAGVRPRPELPEIAPTAHARTINRFDRATEGLAARDSHRPTASPPPATRGVSPLERALRSLMRESTEGRT